MNKFMNGLKNNANYIYTENGAITYKSTNNYLLDLFSLGGAYRNRSIEDCILLFKDAFEENEVYALKCLFYLRDIKEGQGERRFFRTICKWLAENHTDVIRRNLEYIPLFGRWDDLYTFNSTPLEKDAFNLIKKQLKLDVQCKTPSLLAKWLKSENTSSQHSRMLANKTRIYLGMNHKEYRKTLTILRSRIKVLESLMSARRWDEIEFDKIPSRAGMIYRNAFARHDVERMMSEKNIRSYEDFIKDETTKVNAEALYPYEVVAKAMSFGGFGYFFKSLGRKATDLNNIERITINKYWENLKDVFNGYSYNGICVCDTSGSMYGIPLAVALSIGMYCAEHNTGVFANHFFTFSTTPTFVEVKGVDFVDKVCRMSNADWNGSTNIEAVFDQMLNIAIQNHCSQEEIPEGIIIVSDMEFDAAAGCNNYYSYEPINETLFEIIEKRWNNAGYKMPLLTFWNVDARQNNIPMKATKYVNYVSGFSPILFEQVMKGLTAVDLMMDKLNSKRYECIH